MTFNDLLRQALAETAEERAAQMMKVEKKHRFSLAYKLWERKTLRDLRRGRFNKHRNLRKARYIVAALTAALSLLIGATAYASVVLFGRYGFVDKVDYSKMLIENHPSDKTVIEEYYGLPEEDGWEITEYNIEPMWSTLFYQRGDIKITFDQMIINDGIMGQVNTEKADIEMLSLYSENDGFVMEFGESDLLLNWIYDGYLFVISGNINKIQAIELVYSTKVVDF